MDSRPAPGAGRNSRTATWISNHSHCAAISSAAAGPTGNRRSVTSIHTARWINQIADQGWDLHLLNSCVDWKDAPHPLLQNITFHGTWNADKPVCEGQGVESKGCWPLPIGVGIARPLLAGILPGR